MDNVNPDPANIPDDELTLQNPQDDFDGDNSAVDPFANSVGDDPAEELGIPAKEFKNEMDHYAFEDGATSKDDQETQDDRREQMEDLDQNEGSSEN